MTDKILTISGRPPRFDNMVGQKSLIKNIRKRIASKRFTPAWCFAGQTGSGKTTLARILALSYQCTHSEVFGNPCQECIDKYFEFDISEVNTAKNSGVDDMEEIVRQSQNYPSPLSRYRVYILDEAQKLSDSAQQVLLKPFEDSPDSTVWIICTSEPGKIKETLLRRCVTYIVNGLGEISTRKLVSRTLEAGKSDLEVEPLVEALLEKGVRAAGLIVKATENYMSGSEPEKAASVTFNATVDTLAICRAVADGDWLAASGILYAAAPTDAVWIRSSLSAYLKGIILNENANRSKVAKSCEAILELSKLSVRDDDNVLLAATCATIFKICRRFRT